MSPPREISGILQQWLQLTQAEGAAIQSLSWPALKQIQSRKAALGESLGEARRQCSLAENASHPFRPQVARILSLLTRNAELLAAKLREARATQEVLDRANRNLHRIHASYVRPPSRTALQSYS